MGRNARVEKHKVSNSRCDVFERADHDRSAIGKSQQNDVMKALVEGGVRHVSHMRFQTDLRA